MPKDVLHVFPKNLKPDFHVVDSSTSLGLTLKVSLLTGMKKFLFKLNVKTAMK